MFYIEDDHTIRSVIVRRLTEYGYDVDAAGTAMAGLRAVTTKQYDVVLLDLGLPDLDGADLLRMIRAFADLPIIVASARDSEREIVALLKSGADDFLVKPFSLEVLVARIETVMKRTRRLARAADQVYEDGVLRLDPGLAAAHVAGEPLRLTDAEFAILNRLARHPSHIFRTAELSRLADSKELKSTISRLRLKLDRTPLGGAVIASVRDVGYLYRPPDPPAPTDAQHTAANAGDVQNAVRDERRRIARDLHDVVSQRLFTISLEFREFPVEGPEALRRRDELARRIDEANRELRAIVLALDINEETETIAAAIRHCVADYTRQLGFAPTVVIDDALNSAADDRNGRQFDIPTELERDLTATLREALSNAARHSAATEVDVSVQVDPARMLLTLSVIDNGIGLPAERPQTGGLANMAARAQRWRGELELLEADGGGTELDWTVPLRAAISR
ncbi:response regulator [Cryptosporangium phraense]|uniref:ATP-binding response regulator n=1 Tax=Cryptosporangium phraense TaxID=2593070 RepID=UPI0014796E68|nr:response regulator [Cryptosporangium phraense]